MDIKENWMPLAIAALLGTSGGGGVATFLGQHTHPDIMIEIRKVQYEYTLEKAKVTMPALKADKTSAGYIVAQAQLIKYTEKLADLE